MLKKVEKYYLVSFNNNGIYGGSLELTLTPRKKTFIVASAVVEENCYSDDVLEVTDFITGEKIVKDVKKGKNTRGLSFHSLMPFTDSQFADYVSAEFKNDTTIQQYYYALQKLKQSSIENYDKKHIHEENKHVENNEINEVRERARKFLRK